MDTFLASLSLCEEFYKMGRATVTSVGDGLPSSCSQGQCSCSWAVLLFFFLPATELGRPSLSEDSGHECVWV